MSYNTSLIVPSVVIAHKSETRRVASFALVYVRKLTFAYLFSHDAL